MTVPWARARRIAARSAGPRPAVVVGLADAVGLTLAEPVTARTPLPPFDLAAGDGWAVCGPGPWTVETPSGGRLPDGAATAVHLDTALPDGADAVVPHHRGVVRAGKGTTWLYVGDAATGRQSDRPGHIAAGTGIRARGAVTGAGEHLAVAGRTVTPAVVAAAATAGLDALAVVRPPDVVPITIGDARWDRGPARDGRMRDPVTPSLPGAIARAGGRCLPAHHVPGPAGTLADAVRALLEDAAADLILLTGAPGTVGRSDAAGALAGLGGTPLLADIAVDPGSHTLLAELEDGRLVAYLPGDAPGALAGLVTVVLPMLRAMAGQAEPDPVLALLDSAQRGSPGTTTLVPANRRRGELTDTAEVVGGSGILALAGAGTLVVVPPGGAGAGQLVELVELP